MSNDNDTRVTDNVGYRKLLLGGQVRLELWINVFLDMKSWYVFIMRNHYYTLLAMLVERYNIVITADNSS